jgi:hypothetical protein
MVPSVAVSPIARQTWKLALAVGLPIAVPAAIAAGVAGGPLAGIGAFAATFAVTTAILGGVTLGYAVVMTRAGARSPAGVVTGEYADQFDVGGDAATAFERTKAAVSALSGARIHAADAGAGTLEAEASIGPYVQRVHVRVEGTRVHAIARHQPGRKLFDFGAGGKQLADLRRALAPPEPEPDAVGTEAVDRDVQRQLARAAQRQGE